MCTEEEKERIHAVEQCLAKHPVASVCTALGHSRKWLYKWLERHKAGGDEWSKDQPRDPWFRPQRTPREIEEIIRLTRLSLYNAGEFCGAEAIRWKLKMMANRTFLLRPRSSVSCGAAT